MRLLILGINYAPEIISTGVYSTGMAEHLAAHGNDVSVITGQPYFPDWKIFDGWPNWRWKREQHNSVKIIHCPLYVPAKPTGARRIFHHASFACAALPVSLWQALKRRPDVVIVVAPSMLSAPVGWIAAKVAGAASWLHIQDFEVEAAFTTGLLDEASWVGRLAKAFERWVLNRFDRISTISPQMLDKLRKKNLPETRLFELRNWANLSKVKPVDPPSPMRDTLSITTKHVLLYSGNLANKQGLEILPAVARQLAHRDDFTMVICGEGPMSNDLKKLAQDVKSIQFIPLQPIEKLSDLLGMADVHLLPQMAGVADLMLPSKLTNMLASGRPVIATAEPNTALAREIEGCGLITSPTDTAAMAAAIENLLNVPEKRYELGEAARDRALQNWNSDTILRRFERKLRKLNWENQNRRRNWKIKPD